MLTGNKMPEVVNVTADSDFDTINKLTETYFKGLHFADTKALDRIFHDDVILAAPGIRRTKTEWLALVSSRPVPAKEGHPYRYKVLGIDIVGNQAMVKVHCPLLGSNFIDFLGLLKENEKWMFVTKMYADA